MTGTATDVLAVARRNLGIVEGKNNHNVYAPIAGHANNQPWCASFVVACARRAKVTLGNESAYTPSLFNSMEQVDKADIRPGDLVFFRWPTMGRIAHVGFVERVEKTFIVTIEGNTDEAGGRTGGKVMRKKRAYKDTFFARPAYAAPKPPKAPAKKKKDPVLRVGNRGQSVLNVQNALRKHGSKVAATSVFDKATANAVVSFQRRKGLVADGVVGQATWDALRLNP